MERHTRTTVKTMHIFSKKTYRSKDHANSRSKVKILNDACSYNAYVIDYKLTLGILSEHDREMIFGHIYYIHVYLISMCWQL